MNRFDLSSLRTQLVPSRIAACTVAWAVVASLVAIGCDATENAIDCNAICDKYAECWDKDYDESACRANCRTNANQDEGFEQKVDQCAACIEDKACVETFACGVDCSGIVP